MQTVQINRNLPNLQRAHISISLIKRNYQRTNSIPFQSIKLYLVLLILSVGMHLFLQICELGSAFPDTFSKNHNLAAFMNLTLYPNLCLLLISMITRLSQTFTINTMNILIYQRGGAITR
jgi:hypothetical protein